MPSEAAPAAAGISVAIVRDPSLVRTVRLVAAAVARRVSGDEEFVEEVRLAVGEACALLVGPPLDAGNDTDPGTLIDDADQSEADGSSAGPVEVDMRLEDRLRVTVKAAGSVAGSDAPTGDIDGIEPWALLRGLIGDFEIHSDPDGTALSMSWALPSAS